MRYQGSFPYNRFLSMGNLLLKFQNKICKLLLYPNNSLENIHVKVWYQPFWNHTSSYLFVNFSIIIEGCSWYSFVVRMIFTLCWFISINWFKKQSTWRCSRKKVFSLYLRNSQENGKYLLTAELSLPLKISNFVSCVCSANLFSKV